MFPRLQFLNLLDLASNKIKSFEIGFADNVQALRQINVGSNLLTSLDAFAKFLRPTDKKQIFMLRSSPLSPYQVTPFILNAKMNRLKSFKIIDWLVEEIDISIDVSWNKISQIDTRIDSHLKREGKTKTLWPLKPLNKYSTIYVNWDQNQIVCDCTNHEFIKFLALKNQSQSRNEMEDPSLLDFVKFSSKAPLCVNDVKKRVNWIQPIDVTCRIVHQLSARLQLFETTREHIN